jgi:hypothetical protein
MTWPVKDNLEETSSAPHQTPMAAFFAVLGSTTNTLTSIITCVGSLTQTAGGGDVDSDFDEASS